MTPLLILGGVYALALVTSHYDLGLRHMMPIYPVLFVLAGANVFWLTAKKLLFKIALVAFLVGTIAESLSAWPNYLAFFNQAVGGGRHGYQYLVDSSLDWGQDLPGLHQWLEKHLAATSGIPVYLSYFGTADPKFYGVNALLLPGYFDLDSPQTFFLQAGIYCVSASMLQGVYSRLHRPWTAANETLYGQVQAEINRWNATANDPVARKRLKPANETLYAQVQAEIGRWVSASTDDLAARKSISDQVQANYVGACIKIYEQLRAARLCAYLRHRAVDDEVGNSILIYRLSDDEVQRALGGPSPE